MTLIHEKKKFKKKLQKQTITYEIYIMTWHSKSSFYFWQMYYEWLHSIDNASVYVCLPKSTSTDLRRKKMFTKKRPFGHFGALWIILKSKVHLRMWIAYATNELKLFNAFYAFDVVFAFEFALSVNSLWSGFIMVLF